MYIIVNKLTHESAIIKEKITLSSYIDRSTSTILRKDSLLKWETDVFIIYNPQKVLIHSQRGGKNNFKK